MRGKRREKGREEGVWVCTNLIRRWCMTPHTVVLFMMRVGRLVLLWRVRGIIGGIFIDYEGQGLPELIWREKRGVWGNSGGMYNDCDWGSVEQRGKRGYLG